MVRTPGDTVVAVLGAGIQGTCVALELAQRGYRVHLYEKNATPLAETSRQADGRIHLGFTYGKDASHRTARLMLTGAVHFENLMRCWLESNEIGAALSTPSIYAVHRDSLLAHPAIGAHLETVCDLYQDMTDTLGLRYFGADRLCVARLTQAELEEHYDPELVAAAFQTPEICIDTNQLALRLIAALEANDRITLLTKTQVLSAAPTANDHVVVESVNGAEPRRETYAHVVNALWTDRLRVDAAYGIAAPRDWSFRYKVGVTYDSGTQCLDLPSTQIALGSFGSIVNWGNGKVYLSWYPDCRLGMTKAISPDRREFTLTPEETTAITRASVRALQAVHPAAAVLADIDETRRTVEGGFIFAWNTSADIDDPNSQLHQRHQIGVTSYGSYHSIDTGKYTTAPYFALDVARRIAA